MMINLIASFHALQARSPKLVRSVIRLAPADPSIQISMNEFKYQIVARGYDNFFNIGEGTLDNQYDPFFLLSVRY